MISPYTTFDNSSNLDQAKWYAQAMLEGGENEEGKFVPLEDTVLRHEIEKTLKGLSTFKAIAQERWNRRSQSSVGTDIDQHFDKVFDDFLVSADNVETALQRAMKRQLQQFRVLQGSLIAIVMILGTLIGILFQRYERRHISDVLALKDREENLRTTLHSIGDAVIATDASGNVTHLNPMAEKLTGWETNEAEGKPLTEVFRIVNSKTKEPPKNLVLTVIETGEVTGLADHTILIAKDGTEYQIADSAAPIRNDHGSIIGVVLVFRDITEDYALHETLLKAKKEAEYANQAKTEFMANMSHELRTPLNSIIGFSEALTAGKLGMRCDLQCNDYLTCIQTSGNHLFKLVNDLLDVSKIDIGEMKLSETRIDVGETIQASISMVKERAMKELTSLSVDVAEDMPGLHADPTRVKQVVLNLLTNAIKFTPEKGRVSVSACLDDQRAIHIKVEDNGIGIAPEDIPKVLEPFQQVEDVMTRSHDGAGLGLPLAKSLMELHGGTLTINSEVDQGTTVTLRFPPERTIVS